VSEVEPFPFISLGAAAILAVNACALAFQTDGRDYPADADDAALWPPVFDAPEFD
jgi:hypothetical protein